MPDLKRIEGAVQGVLDQEAVELVDLQCVQEGGRRVLRFYLDKEGGITLDDCEQLSHRIGAALDMEEGLLTGSYVLEVSSPGVDRVLKKERDFARFAGRRARVRLREADAGGRRNFSGLLRGVEAGAAVLESPEGTWSWPLERIEEARLVPELEI